MAALVWNQSILNWDSIIIQAFKVRKLQWKLLSTFNIHIIRRVINLFKWNDGSCCQNRADPLRRVKPCITHCRANSRQSRCSTYFTLLIIFPSITLIHLCIFRIITGVKCEFLDDVLWLAWWSTLVWRVLVFIVWGTFFKCQIIIF